MTNGVALILCLANRVDVRCQVLGMEIVEQIFELLGDGQRQFGLLCELVVKLLFLRKNAELQFFLPAISRRFFLR